MGYVKLGYGLSNTDIDGFSFLQLRLFLMLWTPLLHSPRAKTWSQGLSFWRLCRFYSDISSGVLSTTSPFLWRSSCVGIFLAGSCFYLAFQLSCIAFLGGVSIAWKLLRNKSQAVSYQLYCETHPRVPQQKVLSKTVNTGASFVQ